ncbi:hypothetical protein XELAEV_18032837mg [Xenopus laevis]|uniref:Uncharacterized protein n=1 Tax=Xenopus laevis TaxID=8355 RepID=A0A974CIM7_XENLA|nr:hypothetical protein XELAEV_18032837mg [Xenopus laevis]
MNLKVAASGRSKEKRISITEKALDSLYAIILCFFYNLSVELTFSLFRPMMHCGHVCRLHHFHQCHPWDDLPDPEILNRHSW